MQRINKPQRVHAMLTSVALSCRAESLFAAYYFFIRKGYEVTITSVKGGKLPIDPRSVVTPYLTTTVKKGLTDGTSRVSSLTFSQSSYNFKMSSAAPHVSSQLSNNQLAADVTQLYPVILLQSAASCRHLQLLALCSQFCPQECPVSFVWSCTHTLHETCVE